jgi:hypothetical protein
VNSAELISTNKHYFINYDYFIDNYIYRDSVYNAHKKNEHYFQLHPKMVLPNSIFVFVYNLEKAKTNLDNETSNKTNHSYVLDIDDPESLFSDGSRKAPQLTAIIDTLKKKGRTVKLYFNSDEVKVYEIVNVAKRSKTEDLIYEK